MKGTMSKKDTYILQEELRKSNSLDKFEKENNSELCAKSVPEYLNELLIKYNEHKSKIAQRGGLDEGYMYQMFNGTRTTPSRDKLLRLAFGFQLTIEETQKLLRLGESGELYVRRKRDAYLMFALEKGYDAMQANDLLYEKEIELLD